MLSVFFVTLNVVVLRIVAPKTRSCRFPEYVSVKNLNGNNFFLLKLAVIVEEDSEHFFNQREKSIIRRFLKPLMVRAVYLDVAIHTHVHRYT
jgi:hypothetical protein